MKHQYQIMKYSIFTSIILSACLCLSAQPRQSFHLSDVRLLESPFLHAQELNKKYLLELRADRLLAPFLREAGLPAKAESYTNWENTGLDGHIGGHYLSALALMYAATGDALIKERLDYMIGELKRCQDASGNGYIGGVPGSSAMWAEVASGNIRAQSFNLNSKWVPLYNIHKTYAGLRDAWLHAHNADAKDMLVKYADWAIWLTSNLTEEQMQDMLRSEHGGLNETFADVAEITGDTKYLQLARRFSHQFILHPLLEKDDRLTGLHANTQIPKVIGYQRIASLDGNKAWDNAARFFWDIVVSNRSVSIGGNSAREHFHPTDDFSQMISSEQGPETCNTYNMLRLSKLLYETSGDKKYMEFYERALYNHILSSQHPETGGIVYFTQMRPGHYRVYSQPHTSMWCCTGSGIENHGMYGRMIYSHAGNNLYVNLFIPSRLEWKAMNTVIVQESRFPDETKTTFTIHPEKRTAFSLQIRYPDWVNEGALSVKINGKQVKITKNGDGYVSLQRTWKKGDRVEVEMPMRLTAKQLPDNSNYYSLMYGPIVLAAKTGAEDIAGLFADDSRMGHVAHGRQIPLREMPLLVSEPNNILNNATPVSGKPLTFKLTNLYPADKWGDLELIPFFRLHESRYIIYWQQSTMDNIAVLQKQIEDEERERNRLNGITVDMVSCGQQQPESDHFIQFERASTGYKEGYHWRESRGFFSYQLNNKSRTARSVYIAYFNGGVNRRFNVLINDHAAHQITTSRGDDVVTVTFPIPESERDREKLSVKIVPEDNSVTARIVEIRLLTDEY